MRVLSFYLASAALAGACAVGVAGDATGQSRGAAPESIPPPVSQNPAIPPLHLSQTQREKIRQAVDSEDTEVSLTLKSAKPAEKFEPSVGAKLPSALKLHPLPQPLARQMPLLKRYTYVRFKHQVLIVNPMTRKIVEMFPES